MDQIISELCCKGTLFQWNYRKMNISRSVSSNFFVKCYGKKIWEPQYDWVISNPCYNEVCYKGTALYVGLKLASNTTVSTHKLFLGHIYLNNVKISAYLDICVSMNNCQGVLFKWTWSILNLCSLWTQFIIPDKKLQNRASHLGLIVGHWLWWIDFAFSNAFL